MMLTNLCYIFISMTLAGAKKWHVVRWPFPPGQVLVLGSVLEKPDDPQSFLIRPSEVDSVSQEDVLNLSNPMRAAVQSQMAESDNASIRALLPWFSAGFSGEGARLETIETGVDMLNVRAKIFNPTPDSEKVYMSTVLQKPEIANFTRKCLFTKSLYMIVGVATVSKLEMQEGEMRGNHAAASAHASFPQAGTRMATSGSHANTKALGFSVSVQGDMDFAYIAREFSYSKMRKQVGKGHDWTEGALFRAEQREIEHYEEGELVPEFEGFEDEDVDGGETGFTVIP